MRRSQHLNPEEVQRLRSGLTVLVGRRLRDPGAVEEVVQETLARAVESLRQGRLADPSSLEAYVRGIARHVVADVVRAREKRAGSMVPTDPDALPGPHNPLRSVIAEEERRRIRRGMDRLSKHDREVLTLSFFEGLTPREIADRWDRSSQVVRKRKSRALQRLRDLVAHTREARHESPSNPT